MIRTLLLSMFTAGCSLLTNPFDGLTYDSADVVLRWPPNGFMSGSARDTRGNAAHPRFVWEPVTGADHYEVELTASCVAGPDSCDFTHATRMMTASTDWRPSGALAIEPGFAGSTPCGTRYGWRVRACAADCGPWSAVRYFDAGRQRGDLTGDGYADLVVGSSDDARAYVHWGLPSHSYVEELLPVPSGAPRQFAAVLSLVGDTNADGYPEVAVGTGVVQLHDLRGDAPMIRSSPSGTSVFGDALAGGDVNGDGYSDLFIAESDGPGRVYAYLGSASGPSGSALIFESPSGQSGARFGTAIDASGDFDGDGYVDLVIGAPGETAAGRVYVYRGGADFSASVTPSIVDGSEPVVGLGSALAVGDFDGDGFADLALGAPQYLRLWRGGRSLMAQVDGVSAPNDPIFRDLTAGDFDGDGYDDLAYSGTASNGDDHMWANFGFQDGLDVWTDVTPISPGLDQFWVSAAGDVDADGDVELAAISEYFSPYLMYFPLGADRQWVPTPIERAPDAGRLNAIAGF